MKWKDYFYELRSFHFLMLRKWFFLDYFPSYSAMSKLMIYGRWFSLAEDSLVLYVLLMAFSYAMFQLSFHSAILHTIKSHMYLHPFCWGRYVLNDAVRYSGWSSSMLRSMFQLLISSIRSWSIISQFQFIQVYGSYRGLVLVNSIQTCYEASSMVS